MLTTAREEYRKQQRITALGIREARKRASRGPLAVAQSVATFQLASVALALDSVPRLLDEQGIDAPPEGRVRSAALLTGPATVGMVESATTGYALDRLVQTLIVDANRTATTVDMLRRPALAGHVRHLNPPSCSRCAVLAGRVYRWSTGFQRHPGCDCLMVPTAGAAAEKHLVNPTEAFERGEVRGLSQADVDAIRDGADIAQVVNVRRREAGLRQGSSVMERGGRLTPTGITRVASDKAEAAALLSRYGYLT
jgi:hypothetical protein